MTPELDRRTFLKLAGATAVITACGGAGTSTASPSFSPAAGGTVAPTPKPTGRISVYSALNQSTNDELFGALRGDAVTIAVGPRPQRARYRMRDPAELRALLGRLAGARCTSR